MKKLGTILMILGLIVLSIPLIDTVMLKVVQANMLNQAVINQDESLQSAFYSLNSVYERQDEWLSIDENEVPASGQDAVLKDSLVEGYEMFIEEQSLNVGDDALSEPTTEPVTEPVTEPTTEEEFPLATEDEDSDGPHEFVYLGTITIPSIDLEMPLVDGTTVDDLRWSAGHMKRTAYPGEIGNVVIAGHRGYNFGRLFNRLDELGKGDKIIVNTPKGKFVYTVYVSKIVEPEDTYVTNQTDKHKVLTLITCTPIYKSTHRIIIHALMD
ncbi:MULTISPECIES: class D sortase [unclassified Fusibacter]|uniref:class D sortase n=1 Tax=unclassified Fusibacter TaxID=2624464 RepID=UPI0010128AD5|nr:MULTISPECIES: class D sortase [unclassified Fusibacter]MCK8060191.1 class D sortase [Fusibacter sp. A2]NPE22331.1 class D sortase [Fusibacter sp. A1]RXV61104.1 class D sortase [Fusibacter sp. A1]